MFLTSDHFSALLFSFPPTFVSLMFLSYSDIPLALLPLQDPQAHQGPGCSVTLLAGCLCSMWEILALTHNL